MKTQINKYSSTIRKPLVLTIKSKKLSNYEAPNPLDNYIPSGFISFSQNKSDICENIINFRINSSIDLCYKFFYNFDNLLLWNSFIYQIYKSSVSDSYVLHIFLNISFLPPIEFLLPLRVVYQKKMEVIEFQNSTLSGMPFCGRICLKNDSILNQTRIMLYLRYPMPLIAKDHKMNADSYSLIVSEIIQNSINKLRLCVENSLV
mmetsp:Transcript_34477/g.55530  ORF Transcript_34477/g.55530 Transcript_34477/m.55530 type:complete len:204 (+) Transcript_34477:2543-3154(+)